MIVDIDTNGRISITELTQQQAELIQAATLFLAEKQQQHSDPSRFLRGVAIQIDRLLPKPQQVQRVEPYTKGHQHLFAQRNHKQ